MNRLLQLLTVTPFFLVIIGCGSESIPTRIAGIVPFYGSYSGTTLSVGKDDGTTRDLAVVIKPWEDRGFTVEWSTVIYRESGNKQTQHSINFYPSPRSGIFTSAMDTDVFGHTVPFDPLIKEENPYVWASLADGTLMITAMYIIDDGGYELQVYNRSMDNNEMTVEFERIRNGEKVAQVSAKLSPSK